MSNKRWQYQVIEIKPGMLGGVKTEKIQEELTRAGALGWELVNIAFSSALTPAILVLKKEQ